MRACELLVSIGESNRLSTLAALFARLLYTQGRYDDCDRFCRSELRRGRGRRRCLAGTLARRRRETAGSGGDLASAGQLADSAVTQAQQTDFLLIHGDALRDRAEILVVAGEPERAIDDLGIAVALFERKGIVSLAAKARTLRARLNDTAVGARNATPLLS